MKKRAITTILLILAGSFCTDAQRSRLYTSESGLPNSQINDIYQDSKGFIWIATENGLSRFDGMNFSVFRHDKTRSSSIASNLVLATYEDTRKTTWIGTSAGLQTFDRELNSFSHIDLEDDTLPFSDPHISDIIEVDIEGATYILAASSGHGIYVIDINTHKIEKQLQEKINSRLESPFVLNIYSDSEGLLWIGSENGGLSVIDMNEDMVSLQGIWDSGISSYEDNVLVNAFAEAGSKILIGTYNYGILIYNRNSRTIRKAYDRNAGRYHVMSLLKNRTIPYDGENSFLVGLENEGMAIFDSDKECIKDTHLSHVNYDTSSWKVHELIEDNQGNIWVGAFQTGVMVIPRSMYGFDYTNFSKNSGFGDNGTCVTTILSDEDKKILWVGTDGEGLYRIGKDGRKENFSDSNSSITNNSIMDLATDRRGTLWIATYIGGLLRHTPHEGFREIESSREIGSDKAVSLAYSKEDDILYLGTHGKGLFIIDAESEKIIRNLSDDDNKWISTLYIDSSGTLWVGTYNGPMLYDKRNGTLTQVNAAEGLSDGVRTFYEASDGKMWIGTGEGLACLDRVSKTSTTYTESDGLPSNVVTGVLESSDGHLWISTQNGLSRMNPSTEEFKNYYHFDGLQGNEFHAGASCNTKEGKLYFGGIKGITSFYPHMVDQRTHPIPPLYISKLTVMNENVEYDPQLGDENIIDKHITEASMITLPYWKNIFSLEFSVLEYTNPHKITYSYMVEGFDSDWNHAGPDQRVATYTNLPAGRYTMKVKAYFEGEPKDFSYREIAIRILPPWYRTTLAYIFYIILVGLLIWGFYKWRKQNAAQIKEREESEIKELKLRMFTNISHEIRTPLTLVMNPLKKLREAEQDPKQKDLYNLMYRNSLRILRLVNQLLDMRKIDNGQMQLHFLETDVVYFIKDIMQSFDNLAVSKNINLSLHTVQDVNNLWIDQGNFDKIVFNILSNAFKFTPDNGEITISISEPVRNNGILSENIHEYVEFVIENSGSRVEERHLDRLFDRFFQVDIKDAKEGSGVGLNLAKMLVDLHHGEIKAYNTENGMAFSIKIPVGCTHLSAKEMTKPTNHKDLYTKMDDHNSSREDVVYTPQRSDKEVRQTKTKRSIILIDDDNEMRAYLKLELQAIYNVETCANAKDAWSKISTTVPDAIVTDLVMEGMDGAELCAKVKKNPGTNHIPVLILSSSADEQNIQRCLDCGADRFFTKPISLEILKKTIANAIAARDTMKNKFSKDIDYKFNELTMPDSGNQLIDKVIRIIRENIEDPDFGVENLSHEVGMSRVHLNRKLKEIMNISPSSLIRSIRLKQAAYLLINNKVNISEVAYKVGFSTHSYFSNSFHDYFGMTPKEFVARYMNCTDDETLKKIFK